MNCGRTMWLVPCLLPICQIRSGESLARGLNKGGDRRCEPMAIAKQAVSQLHFTAFGFADGEFAGFRGLFCRGFPFWRNGGRIRFHDNFFRAARSSPASEYRSLCFFVTARSIAAARGLGIVANRSEAKGHRQRDASLIPWDVSSERKCPARRLPPRLRWPKKFSHDGLSCPSAS